MTDELWRRGATELAAAIAKREVTSREVVDAHIGRIDDIGDAVNAVVAVLADEALAEADEADRATTSGEALGPLHGVPFTVKENIDCLGSATTQGLVAFSEARPPLDAPHVERMRAAGAIPVARTNLPDFGLRWHTDNALRGPTRNPWDPKVTPGGSSGGEAAALATGMTPLGLGNDYGGSLRIPSACCGTAALKPTVGRIPEGSSLEPEDFVLSIQLFAVEGPMARRVADLQAALEVMAGPHRRDPKAVPAPLNGPAVEGPIGVAVVPDPRSDGSTAPEVVEAVHRAADALADAGYELRDAAPPSLPDARDVWVRIVLTEVASMWPLLGPLVCEDADRFIGYGWEAHPPMDLDGLLTAYTTRHAIARAWRSFQAETPLVLGPVMTTLPFDVGYDLEGPDAVDDILHRLTLTVAGNLLGLPSVTVPTGTADGLPTGVQVLGPGFREDLCLDAAEAIEARLGTLTPLDPRAERGTS